MLQILVYFLCKNCTPSWKRSPPLSQQPPPKLRSCQASPLFENLVGGLPRASFCSLFMVVILTAWFWFWKKCFPKIPITTKGKIKLNISSISSPQQRLISKMFHDVVAWRLFRSLNRDINTKNWKRTQTLKYMTKTKRFMFIILP